VENVKPFLAEKGLTEPNPETLRAAIPGIRARAHTYKDAATELDFYFREPPELDRKAQEKLLGAEAAARMVELAAALEQKAPWDAPTLEAAVREWSEARGLAIKDVAQPARVALTGRSASPPLFDVMVVLGKERSLARLRRAPSLVPA
jgi:glutamyl-tRNA synthetase